MCSNPSLFAVKLQEMEREYESLHSCIGNCAQKDRRKIREALEQTRVAVEQERRLLQKRTEGSRSQAMAKLAQAQLAYNRQVEALLQDQLRAEVHAENGTPEQERAETMALYAEYAIDLATQSMRYALLAALSAMELQFEVEETAKERHT